MLCPQCHKNILINLRTCPQCGARVKKRVRPLWVFTFGAVVVTIGLSITFNTDKIEKKESNPTISTTTQAQTQLLQTWSQKMISFWNNNHYESAYRQALALKEHPAYRENAIYVIAMYSYKNNEAHKALPLFIELQTSDSLKTTATHWVKKIKLELAEKEGLDKNASEHFFLRYEGTRIHPFRNKILQALEHFSNILSLKLRYYPEEKFEIIVYDDPKYSGLTELPDWAAASFDGKLRIPFQAIKHLDANKMILMHELTHAYLHQINPHLPTWIQEGLAQYFENAPLKKEVLTQNKWTTLSDLQSSFLNIRNTEKALLAYQISLALIHELESLSYFETLVEMVKEFTPNNPDQAFKKHYGITIEKLYSQTHTRWRSTL